VDVQRRGEVLRLPRHPAFLFFFWVPMILITMMAIAVTAKWINIPPDRFQVL
jgi:hypothetical protein